MTTNQIEELITSLADALGNPDTTINDSAFGIVLAKLVCVVVADVRRIADSLETLAKDANNRNDAITTIGLSAMLESVMTEMGWVKDELGRWRNPEDDGIIVTGATEREMGG